MSARKVIVFGPTGGVASAAARIAAEKGAKVFLAMRDTGKTIPGLSASAEKQLGCERVSADLAAPDSVYEAVTKTGAKAAFLYLVWGIPDVVPTLEALKRGGVEQVVFLSSISVSTRGGETDPSAVPPSSAIAYAHAQVELRLAEVFGPDGFVALRPASFASNTLQHKDQVNAGRVDLFMPKNKADHIVPEDIGRAGARVLVDGAPADGTRVLNMLGARPVTNEDTINILAAALGKKVEITEASAEQERKHLTEVRGLPPFLADDLINFALMGGEPGRENTVLGEFVPDEWWGNLQKYSGKKATTFEDWVQQNVELFRA